MSTLLRRTYDPLEHAGRLGGDITGWIGGEQAPTGIFFRHGRF